MDRWAGLRVEGINDWGEEGPVAASSYFTLSVCGWPTTWAKSVTDIACRPMLGISNKYFTSALRIRGTFNAAATTPRPPTVQHFRQKLKQKVLRVESVTRPQKAVTINTRALSARVLRSAFCLLHPACCALAKIVARNNVADATRQSAVGSRHSPLATWRSNSPLNHFNFKQIDITLPSCLPSCPVQSIIPGAWAGGAARNWKYLGPLPCLGQLNNYQRRRQQRIENEAKVCRTCFTASPHRPAQPPHLMPCSRTFLGHGAATRWLTAGQGIELAETWGLHGHDSTTKRSKNGVAQTRQLALGKERAPRKGAPWMRNARPVT